MSRPDYGRAHRQHRLITDAVGETAIWRKYVSASAGTPVAGAGDEQQFTTTTITATFRLPTNEEFSVPGGQIVAGDVFATMQPQPDMRDEIVWRGTAYGVAGAPYPQNILGRTVHRVLLRRGGASA